MGQVLAYQAVEQANRMYQAELARLERLEVLCIERSVFIYVAPGYESAKALRS